MPRLWAQPAWLPFWPYCGSLTLRKVRARAQPGCRSGTEAAAPTPISVGQSSWGSGATEICRNFREGVRLVAPALWLLEFLFRRILTESCTLQPVVASVPHWERPLDLSGDVTTPRFGAQPCQAPKLLFRAKLWFPKESGGGCAALRCGKDMYLSLDRHRCLCRAQRVGS